MPLRWRAASQLRILDFDCEARPLSWINQDYVSKEPTAIAAKFIGEPGDVSVWQIGSDGRYNEQEAIDMIEGFRAMYDQADMVTGHYIRGYDLPMLNGATIEYELAPLGPKLAHDTKLDLMKQAGLSMSQENLSETFELEHPKFGMNTPRWRAANRLTPDGVALTRKRVVDDVLQHIELRSRLMQLGYLGQPRMWTCGGSRGEEYRP